MLGCLKKNPQNNNKRQTLLQLINYSPKPSSTTELV